MLRFVASLTRLRLLALPVAVAGPLAGMAIMFAAGLLVSV
jgi:hypothetical protein